MPRTRCKWHCAVCGVSLPSGSKSRAWRLRSEKLCRRHRFQKVGLLNGRKNKTNVSVVE